MTPDGHYVLVANRGADMISVFWIDPESGRPTLRSEVACGGRFPRAIRFDPSARYLAVANQKSDDISIFGWDFTKGVLSGKPLIKIDLQTPLDMIFAD
jgi:6-phosphogluconolactonase